LIEDVQDPGALVGSEALGQFGFQPAGLARMVELEVGGDGAVEDDHGGRDSAKRAQRVLDFREVSHNCAMDQK